MLGQAAFARNPGEAPGSKLPVGIAAGLPQLCVASELAAAKSPDPFPRTLA